MTLLRERREEHEKYCDELRYFIELATKCSLTGLDQVTREIDRIVPIGPRTISQETFNFLVDAEVIVDTGAKGRRGGEIRSYGDFAKYKGEGNCILLRERASGMILDLELSKLYRVSSAVVINLERFLSYRGSGMPLLSCRLDPEGQKRLYYVNEFSEWSCDYSFIKDYIGDQQT